MVHKNKQTHTEIYIYISKAQIETTMESSFQLGEHSLEYSPGTGKITEIETV